ncbi:hypothetical protein HHK36_003097 [Tetracentron sinense]|uniref:AAA+ ATPase domain-containing protein n=1 Tax=Tetracentron sinense TaxID=13715 RepID=A0A835DP09_TETSI|nr:hypothetical protein HHK36_003097 [Tetracentron sinense]
MKMFSLADMPSTTTVLSAYASIAGSMMLVRSIANEFIPHQFQAYLLSSLRYFFLSPISSQLTLVIEELDGISRNQVFEASEIYLRTKITPSAERLRVSKASREKNFTVTIEKGEEIVDEFQGIQLKWRYICSESNSNDPYGSQLRSEHRSFELVFSKKHKERVLDSYLPYVLNKSRDIKEENKVLKLYTLGSFYDDAGGGGLWGSVNLDHPATFDKLAMDPEVKKALMDDLERFVKGREFYKKVGKAWKRGYLLYGPPGTGKSSLIAAMANYLNFDIYDLELANLQCNSELRRLLVATANRSILVIEDIDCSVELRDRQFAAAGGFEPPNSQLTLSGLLNFIDGLWSSCGDERIIVFTTNHKDRLDPALLRPGRMDMHIHLSYCTNYGFKLLASNYLGIHENHRLFGEIEGLIENAEVTPAEVAEELMKNDNADIALEGLTKFLKRKTMERDEVKNEGVKEAEIQEPKKQKIENGEERKFVRRTLRRGTRTICRRW